MCVVNLGHNGLNKISSLKIQEFQLPLHLTNFTEQILQGTSPSSLPSTPSRLEPGCDPWVHGPQHSPPSATGTQGTKKGTWCLAEDGHVARGLWLNNSGKRWADLAPMPWAALE